MEKSSVFSTHHFPSLPISWYEEHPQFFPWEEPILNRNDSRFGSLPSYAPLAAAYVPMQESAADTYETQEALYRGTLFPGLDLPFRNVGNDGLPSGPMQELMAIDFVADELERYLDTHSDDREAFDMYQTFLALGREARERYARSCGPITQPDMLGADRYTWLGNPWPWEYCAGRES